MSAHARLSPSSAHRWLECPGSRRLVEDLPPSDQDTENRYSREGTLAHRAAELRAADLLGLELPDPDPGMRAWRATVEAEGFDAEEMLMHADGWAARLGEYRRDGFTVALEHRVATGVPQCWGTADAVAYDETSVAVLDYKYGKGVRVFCADNPQTMLYGLGGLDKFNPQAETVWMSIHQPRLDHFDIVAMTAEDLRQWRDAVARPGALLALSDDAPITPSSEACRFCPVAGRCVARADYMLRKDFGDPDLMDPLRLSETMSSLDDLEAWASAVRSAAFQHVKDGKDLPGWKIVNKRGQRKIVDPEAVIGLLGDDAVRSSLRPLGELEKLVGGKKALTEKLGDLLVVAEGSEVLVPESDPRPPADPAADFA